MDPIATALAWTAAGAAILFCLVLLPRILDRRGDLPYNSVASRAVAWSSFASLLAVVVVASGGLGWSPTDWVLVYALIGFAALWDLYDLKTRRIPRGRHPDR